MAGQSTLRLYTQRDKGKTIIVELPEFEDGGWLLPRDKDRPYTMDNPFENKILHTAFGMKVIMRVKVKEILPEFTPEFKADIYEKDLIKDDDIEKAKGILLKKVKHEGEEAIFEGEAQIGKKDFWETTGRESLSEFYFRAYYQFSQKMIIERKFPLDEKDYLRIKAPGAPGEQIFDISKIYDTSAGTGGNYYHNPADFAKERYGMPETIVFKNTAGEKKVWGMKSIPTTYCCGFTFWCIMRYLQSNRIIDNVSAEKMETFRKYFYGAGGDEEWMYVKAVDWLKIGDLKSIKDNQCQPGDIIQLLPETGQGGHSVIFLEYIKHNDGTIIGIKCRGSHGKPYVEGQGGISDADAIFYVKDYSNGPWSRTKSLAARITQTEPL